MAWGQEGRQIQTKLETNESVTFQSHTFSMALITFAGYPASGKSSRANQLADFLNSKLKDTSQFSVKILSDHSLGLTRAVYDGMYLTSRSPSTKLTGRSQTADPKNQPEAPSLPPYSDSCRRTLF